MTCSKGDGKEAGNRINNCAQRLYVVICFPYIQLSFCLTKIVQDSHWGCIFAERTVDGPAIASFLEISIYNDVAYVAIWFDHWMIMFWTNDMLC